MKCKACGKPIDANSRFCTYCDHDNYPEMNRVKTKNDVTKHNTYNNRPYSQTTGNDRSTSSGTGTQRKNISARNTAEEEKDIFSPSKGGCVFGILIITVLIIIIIAILENS